MPTTRLPLVLVLAAAGLAACSKSPEPVTGEGANEARVAELERVVRELQAERDGTLRAAGADGVEKTTLGRTVGELKDQVQAQRAKIEELERRLATAAAGAAGPDAGGAADGATPAPMPSTFEPSSDGSFSPAQVATFRRIYDEMQKQRDAEQQLDNLRKALARAEVKLTPEQEASVVRLQREFGDKRQELFASARTDGAGSGDMNDVRAKIETLRAEFETNVRAVVPAAEADKVVEALKRGYPGFFPRPRDGRETRRGN